MKFYKRTSRNFKKLFKELENDFKKLFKARNFLK